MKELTLETLLSVMEEVFGPVLFWALLAAAVIVTAAYLYVLVRDRAVSWRKFLWAQLSMPVGAVAAVAFVFWATSSGLRDIGGPIDLILLIGVGVLGAVGLAILVYTIQALAFRRTE